MKKLMGVLLIGTMIMGLGGCAGTSGGSDGSTASLGDITVVSREDGSGTRSAFTELFGIEEDGKDLTTEDAEVVNKTDVMLQSVAGNPSAIGYVSLGSLSDQVKAVSIEGVEPSAENILNDSYQIARPFYLAYKEDVSELAKDFMAFILAQEGQEVISEDYVPVVSDAAPYAGSQPAGKIVVAGSSSVSPVMEKLKEAYLAVNPNAEIEVQMSDSSAGIRAAEEGTCDIGMLSRELKDSEKANVQSTVIAMDGIAVIVNQDNPISNLSKDQVGSIYKGETLTWEEIEG